MTVIARVQLTAKAPWIDKFQKMVDDFSPGGALFVTVLQRTMVRGILSAVRKRFFEQMHHALQVSMLDKEGGERIGKLIEAKSELRRLKEAYRALDTAMLSGKQSKMKAAQARLEKAQQAVVDRYAERKGSRLTEARNARMQRMRLGVITGQLMRQRMMRVLEYLTASTYVSTPQVSGDTTAIAAGAHRFLNMIETPSATVTLTGVRSKSKFKTLWRHLEFGSGVAAKPAPDGYRPPKVAWLYGRPGESGEGGLRVLGTKPMSFLWTDALTPAIPAQGTIVQTVFEEAMGKLIPKLT